MRGSPTPQLLALHPKPLNPPPSDCVLLAVFRYSPHVDESMENQDA